MLDDVLEGVCDLRLRRPHRRPRPHLLRNLRRPVVCNLRISYEGKQSPPRWIPGIQGMPLIAGMPMYQGFWACIASFLTQESIWHLGIQGRQRNSKGRVGGVTRNTGIQDIRDDRITWDTRASGINHRPVRDTRNGPGEWKRLQLYFADYHCIH